MRPQQKNSVNFSLFSGCFGGIFAINTFPKEPKRLQNLYLDLKSSTCTTANGKTMKTICPFFILSFRKN